MPMKPFLNTLAAAAIATIAGVASFSGARAMPIASPAAAVTLQDTRSGEALAPHSTLVQEAGWHRHGWHRHGMGWHQHGMGWHGRGGWHGHHGWHRHWH